MSPKENEVELPEANYRDALIKWGGSVGAAIAFGAGVWFFKGASSGLEFFAGYLVEQSLSVDNLFVFLLLFDFFQVPVSKQGKVLNYGIWGAIVLRFLFVVIGAEALEYFNVVLLGFAGILLFSSYKILAGWAAGEEEEEEDLSNNKIVKFAKGLFPSTENYDGDRFFTQVDGVSMATPLFICLICVELSDVVFATDSVPAVFGVTRDPFIVYTSNIFAILGLRSLFAILSKAVSDLPYLEPAVAIVLGFVGIKLGASYFGFEVEPVYSLDFIVACLGGGIALSLYEKKKQ